jgi:hypothetical protein
MQPAQHCAVVRQYVWSFVVPSVRVAICCSVSKCGHLLFRQYVWPFLVPSVRVAICCSVSMCGHLQAVLIFL